MLAAGLYNGQGANHPEGNNNMHHVVRVTYPWELGHGQMLETSLQAYTGRYAVGKNQLSEGAVLDPGNFQDRRVAASLILYPQPFGLQAEYNVGDGPSYSAETQEIRREPLRGGYVQVMWRTKVYGQSLIPFFRYQTYEGGVKAQQDARFTQMHSSEMGVEWQPNANLEFTTELDHSDRTTSDASDPHDHQIGTILRLQMQVNY